MADKRKKIGGPDDFSRLDAVLTVVVLLLIAGALYYYWTSGGLYANFPKALVAEPGTYVSQNSHTSYPGGVDQFLISYISNKNLKDNISAFHALLSKDGWQILRDADPRLTVAFIYATKNSTTLNITFDATDSKAIKVTETYATKN